MGAIAFTGTGAPDSRFEQRTAILKDTVRRLRAIGDLDTADAVDALLRMIAVLDPRSAPAKT